MLKNKVAIITGSSTGLGAGAAVKFAAEGAEGIMLHGRDVEGLKKTAQQCVAAGIPQAKVAYVAGDITSEEVQHQLVNECVAKLGRIDVLVNNAGIMTMANLQQSNMADFDRLFAVNVKAPASLTKICIPHLIQSKGVVVNVSSALGEKATTMATFYSMTKAALDHFTRCMALELGPHQIRVNSINPGYIPNTSIVSRNGHALPDHVATSMIPMHALRRIGTSEEVSQGIAWLASNQSSFTTGQTLLIDGGYKIQGFGAPPQ